MNTTAYASCPYCSSERHPSFPTCGHYQCEERERHRLAQIQPFLGVQSYQPMDAKNCLLQGNKQ